MSADPRIIIGQPASFVALTTGLRLGVYEIVSPLGVGGMGEVYKARDTRLDRIVAIKVLPLLLAADPHFRERFDREARTISQLDHAHICALYDVGEQDGMSFLVMQYLEGETLETRLKNGALPLEQALQYAIQIADALDKAHRAGIVHRDLKPGNIMLTKQGAKLLDFGLAKTTTGAGTAGLSMLPTTPPGLTAEGTILGTFQYMAPEQLEGQDADARSDIFAFGALLHEMITGRKAFEGKSQASLISAIMSSTPPAPSSLQPVAPPALDRVVQTCLMKHRDDRFQTAHDLMLQLRWIANGAGAPGSSVPSPTTKGIGSRVLPYAAALLALTTILLAGWVIALRLQQSHDPAGAAVVRLSVVPPERTLVPTFALSPDAKLQISTDASPYPRPRWSSDGKELFYISAGYKLMSVAVSYRNGIQAAQAKALFGVGWAVDYTASRDNRRLLFLRMTSDPFVGPIDVALNWTAALGK
jgi:serine/threonine protein kinase